MRIYIRTPLVNKSQMVPHTVEHCAGYFNRKIDDFFDFSQGLSWDVSPGLTCFEFDKWVKYEDILEHLFQPIEKDTVTYEHKVLEQELWNPKYIQKIYEKVLKKYLDPDFSMNQYEEVPREDVKNYHEKYYKRENVIVADNEKDYKIIFKWFNPKEKEYKEAELRKEKLKSTYDVYIVYILNNYNAENYRKLFFCFRIFDYYLHFLNRFKYQKYFYQNNYLFQLEESFIAVVEDTDYSKLDKNFFEWWKKYLINALKYWYYKERFFLNEYFYWIPKTRKEVIQICKNFTREEFKEFLEI